MAVRGRCQGASREELGDESDAAEKNCQVQNIYSMRLQAAPDC
jgi:hypothetical protein